MWRIFVPLQYLKIDHPEKWKFDWGLPLILTLVFVTPLFSAQFRDDVIASLEIVGKISSFLGVLTGFYIAALAAVATFGKREMDDPMPGEVRLEHRVNAETYFEQLSRRRFLSFLFGYMALVTLALYVLGFVYMVLDKYALATGAPNWRSSVFVIFWIFYVFSLSNILSNTMLGLFYLTDRIHRPNRVVRSSIDDLHQSTNSLNH